ncbi:mRNA-capping enzyme subunit beta [Wallemia ichthyophaga EXF-994]|uniref:mRNA-capping enzyme subunit beta n=1 Tax=Wallemia ichthyophaga (strain EXF-994 / CBS 113033) TaxID=1299270 RepID=R9AH19_WALI9|nr:mRNA-capping enzyme subunit beta [Wallemia ichthyophaga EXF-994]EOR01425.1 mRNA-capping enzyme subunit beta [Wallemia ichthyophaga EXF-994]
MSSDSDNSANDFVGKRKSPPVDSQEIQNSAKRPNDSVGKRKSPPVDSQEIQNSAKRPRVEPMDTIKMEKNMFGLDPSDEFIKEISDWIWLKTKNCKHKVEVEAKVGRFLDQSAQRAGLPVAVETILSNTDGLKFESNMTEAQHKHYNGILNKRASQLNQNLRSKIDCVHNKEIDSFHSSGRGSGKVRVTRDQGKTDIKEMIEKVRVADLAIYSPKRLFDWRLSINMEVPHNDLPKQDPYYQRKKDRMSYTQQEMQVDLTQVFARPGEPPTHELELEIRRPKFLMEEGKKRERGLPNMCKLYRTRL